MTDKETLYEYRIEQAEETFAEANRMLKEDFSARSVINRAYYSMFYALLALLIKTISNVKTSKHSGIISIFDREFVKTERIDKKFSKMLHETFDARLEVDYKDFAEFSREDAAKFVDYAKEYISAIKQYISQ